MPYRIVSGILGLFYFLQGVLWLVDPAASAEGLGMPLLDGVGRSTQVGDLSSFFLALGAMCILGGLRSNAQWLHAAAILIGLPAINRTLAWWLHGADFTTTFIVIEGVSAVVLVFLASRIEGPAGDASA